MILSFSLMGVLREFISAAKAAGKRDETFSQGAAVPVEELSVTRTASSWWLMPSKGRQGGSRRGCSLALLKLVCDHRSHNKDPLQHYHITFIWQSCRFALWAWGSPMMGRMAAKPRSVHDMTTLSQCLGTSCGMDAPVVNGINPGNNCKGSGQCPGNCTPKVQQWQVHSAAAQSLWQLQDKAQSGLLSTWAQTAQAGTLL